MIKPKVGDVLVYKSEEDKSAFFSHYSYNEELHDYFYNCGFTAGCISHSGDVCQGDDHDLIIVSQYELKYFKIKEKEMLKPDDIIDLKMTAIDGFKLLAVVGLTSGAHALFDNLIVALGIDESPFIGLGKLTKSDWGESSDLTLAALAQFKNPKQDKIDALEKRINDAAAELAKLKGE